MPLTLDRVVPWGRSYDEYTAMFDLSPADLAGRILGCGDGPASFNAEATRQGRRVVSCDPLYRFPAAAIAARIRATYDQILGQLHRDSSGFAWRVFQSPEQLGQARLAAMQRFLEDYRAGLAGGRYVAGELPALPFAGRAFDLALCSHFLFLYSAQLSLPFHLAAIRELVRVAGEVRLFPLLDMSGVESLHLEPVLAILHQWSYIAEVRPVSYEFQRGATAMLRVVGQPACHSGLY